MNNLSFDATIQLDGTAPRIVRLYSYKAGADLFGVASKTIERALGDFRRVNGRRSDTIVARTGTYAGKQVKLKQLTGPQPKSHLKPGAVTPKTRKGPTGYYTPFANKSTAKSKIALRLMINDTILSKICGVPQALRTLIDTFPDDLGHLKDDNHAFAATAWKMSHLICKSGEAIAEFSGYEVHIVRYDSMKGE